MVPPIILDNENVESDFEFAGEVSRYLDIIGTTNLDDFMQDFDY